MRPIKWKNKRKQYNYKFSNKPGFTLVEILVSVTIFVIVTTLAIQAFLNVLTSYRRLDVSSRVLEQGRFLMERMVKEIRNNNIDYAYYYLQNPDNEDVSYYDYLNIGPDSSSIEQQIPNDVLDTLALLSPDGKKRTIISSGLLSADTETGLNSIDSSRDNPQLEDYRVYLKRMNYNAASNSVSNPSGSVDPDPLSPLLVFPAQDPYEDESEITVNWQWYNDPQFVNDENLSEEQRVNLGWKPFSSNDISIRTLKFIVSPPMDPYKFWDTTNGGPDLLNAQSQPMVTIRMQVVPSIRNRAGFEGEVPSLDLQTTVSLRTYNQIYYFGWPRQN